MSKIYSLIIVGSEEIKKEKGVNKILLKTQDTKTIFMFC